MKNILIEGKILMKGKNINWGEKYLRGKILSMGKSVKEVQLRTHTMHTIEQ